MQGVSFRAGVLAEANRLRLAGWVRNQPDGSLWVAAEGDAAALKDLVRWCGRGPAWAEVSAVKVTEDRWQGLSGFKVLE